MDTKYHPQDQPLLMNVYNNFTQYGCKVFELPSQSRHFTLLSKSIVKGKKSTYPTIVHITSLRTKKYNDYLDGQKDFLREALHVFNGTEMMTPDISWYDVAQPVDTRGRKPKKKTKKNRESDVDKAENTTVALA